MRTLILSLLPCVLCAAAPQEPAHIQVFQATAAAVRKGAPVTLRWSVSGTDKVRLEPLGLVLPAQGEMTQPVTGRAVYWLHAANLWGGQSLPLVVEVLPEEPAAPALGLPTPVLATVPDPAPPAPAPQPAALPVPAGATGLQTRPLAVAARPQRRLVRRSNPRRAWIQFAAGTNLRSIRKLQRHLQRNAAVPATLTARARRAGMPMQLVRTGPFPSVAAARQRLQELAPLMAAMNLKPIVVSGPGRAESVQLLASVPEPRN